MSNSHRPIRWLKKLPAKFLALLTPLVVKNYCMMIEMSEMSKVEP